MEHRRLGMGVTLFITLGLVLLLSLAVQGESDLSAPQFVRVINKPRMTWAEIQVQRLINGHIYEPCPGGHVVHFRLSGETEWRFPDITEKMGGRFVITGLKGGNSYEIRVACKDNKIPPSVGAWSDPTSVVTPLANPKSESGHSESDDHGDLHEDDKLTPVSIGAFSLPPTFTSILAIASTTVILSRLAFTF